DDKRTHEVTAFVSSLAALTTSLQFSFAFFTAEAGQYQHQHLANAIRRHDIVNSENNTARVAVCTRLFLESIRADPIFNI
ncbi:hypothetical protein V3C99_015540, partial [Haemonchus contortus]